MNQIVLRGKTIKTTHSTSLILCYEARGTSTDTNKPAVQYPATITALFILAERYFCHHIPWSIASSRDVSLQLWPEPPPRAGDMEHPQGHPPRANSQEALPDSREFFGKVVLKILCAVLRKTCTVQRHKQPPGIISYVMDSQTPAADRCAFTHWHLSPPMIINLQTCCGLKEGKCQREI